MIDIHEAFAAQVSPSAGHSPRLSSPASIWAGTSPSAIPNEKLNIYGG